MVWIVAEADPGEGGRGGTVQARNTEVYSLHADLSLLILYLQSGINNYKQTTKSTVCVNYDYATIRNTAVVQFCGNKSAKFPGKLRHITEQIYDFTQP